MSFLFFDSIPVPRLALLFDYGDETNIDSIHEQQGIHYRLSTSEGTGSWLVLEKDRPAWGGQLRRSDTPFNDCLPPTEHLLEASFSPGQNANNWAQQYLKLAEDGFYNPADSLIYTPGSNELIHVKQSFQTTIQKLNQSSDCFVEHPERQSPELGEWPKGKVPDPSKFTEWVENASNPDGMRPCHAGVHAEWNDSEWEIQEVSF